MELKLLILFVIFQLAASQRSLTEINTIQGTDRNNSINVEKTIADNCKNASERIANLTARLEAQFLSRPLVTSLKNLKDFIDMLATVLNWLPYETIDTCSDVNNQVTLFDFDAQKITCVRTKALQNATRVATLSGSVLANSAQIFVTANALYQETLTLYRWVIANVYNVLINYYAVTLGQAYSNCLTNRVFLNAYKRTYCSCLDTKTLGNGTNSTQLETNVGTVEREMMRRSNQLKNASITANNLCKAAFTSLTTGSSAGDLGIRVSNLVTLLTAQTTNDDYPTMSWSNVADCSNLALRIRYLWAKYNQYLNILISNRANCSAILSANILTNITAAQPNSLFMTASQITALRDCLNATASVNAFCSTVLSQLLYSMGRYVQMIADMQGISDTFCTCTNATATTRAGSATTTVSTTTTTAGTTTTISPCGTFVPYTSPAAVLVDGFNAGTGADGKSLYIGRGANTNCGQILCPGYASTDAANPGVFMSCAIGLQQDNSPTTAAYLQTNPLLTWIPANSTSTLAIPGALTFTTQGGAFKMFYCRTLDPTTNAYYVGKCAFGGSSGFFYWDASIPFEFSLVDSYEVLTCA